MKGSSQPLPVLTAAQHEAVVRKWLAQTLETYPEQTSRFLLENKDPFHNPVGHALNEGLPVLVEELFGSLDRDRVGPVLDEIVRIRAVQDFSPSQAIGFLILLKKIVREELDSIQFDPATLDGRIDELSLFAFDLYVQSRDRMAEIKVNEAKRRMYVLERLASRDGQDSGPAPG